MRRSFCGGEPGCTFAAVQAGWGMTGIARVSPFDPVAQAAAIRDLFANALVPAVRSSFWSPAWSPGVSFAFARAARASRFRSRGTPVSRSRGQSRRSCSFSGSSASPSARWVPRICHRSRSGRHRHRPSMVVGGALPLGRGDRERDPRSHRQAAARPPRIRRRHPRLLGAGARSQDRCDAGTDRRHQDRGGPAPTAARAPNIAAPSTPGCASSFWRSRRPSSKMAAPAARTGTPRPRRRVGARRGDVPFNELCRVPHGPGGQGPPVVATQRNPHFAPDLTHVASRTTLGAGVIPNTPAMLAAWLRDPQEIKGGCHMPDAQLTSAQVADLVAYFETLQ